MTAPAGYSLYDLLRTLCERVGWPTEDEKRAALGSIDTAERMGILGDLAQQMACEHPQEPGDRINGRCMLCGRQIDPSSMVYRYQPRSGRGW